MSGIKHIFGKEMARVFKDRKMIFSVFVLPVVVMIGIMGLTTNMAKKQAEDIESHKSIVYIQNMPESFEKFLADNGLDYNMKQANNEAVWEEAKTEIKDGEADLLIEFPKQFEEQVASYEAGQDIPQIKTYYNPSENYSAAAYREISENILEGYRQMLLLERIGDINEVTIFTVNSDNAEMIIQDDQKASGKALGTMLPYFITILLFAGAMGIGTDMIAGEKERGTMASLLVSPVKRNAIVLGKVFSLMAISGISSGIYVGAMVVAMPKVMGGADAGFDVSLTAAQIAMLAVLMVALAFFYSAIIVVVSVFAKTVKEANTYVMPAYMLILIVGMITMFTNKEPEFSSFCVPIYNSALVLQGILSGEVTMAQYGITLGMTIVLGLALCGIIVKAFESEKVMSC